MKQYEDLTKEEKKAFEQIEMIYGDSELSLTSFIKVLAILINKWKGRE